MTCVRFTAWQSYFTVTVPKGRWLGQVRLDEVIKKTNPSNSKRFTDFFIFLRIVSIILRQFFLDSISDLFSEILDFLNYFFHSGDNLTLKFLTLMSMTLMSLTLTSLTLKSLTLTSLTLMSLTLMSLTLMILTLMSLTLKFLTLKFLTL